jgi:hypothetical protein
MSGLQLFWHEHGARNQREHGCVHFCGAPLLRMRLCHKVRDHVPDHMTLEAGRVESSVLHVLKWIEGKTSFSDFNVSPSKGSAGCFSYEMSMLYEAECQE